MTRMVDHVYHDIQWSQWSQWSHTVELKNSYCLVFLTIPFPCLETQMLTTVIESPAEFSIGPCCTGWRSGNRQRPQPRCAGTSSRFVSSTAWELSSTNPLQTHVSACHLPMKGHVARCGCHKTEADCNPQGPPCRQAFTFRNSAANFSRLTTGPHIFFTTHLSPNHTEEPQGPLSGTQKTHRTEVHPQRHMAASAAFWVRTQRRRCGG